MSPARLVLFFVAGGVVGTLGDLVHSHTGVLAYPHPTWLGEPWWILPLMGVAGIATGVGANVMRRRGHEPADGTTRDAVTCTLWFAAAYVASGIFQREPVALAVAYGATFVARALSGPPSSIVWWLGIGTAIVGPLWEAFLSSTGAFRYLHPDLGNIPSWLPGLYLHAALMARAIERRWPLSRAVT